MIYIPVYICYMSFGTFVFSVEEEKIHSHLENVLHLQSCLFLNIVGRISVSMQNMSAFLKDSFVSTKLLYVANVWQILLVFCWLSEQCHQFCQESDEIWEKALIWML